MADDILPLFEWAVQLPTRVGAPRKRATRQRACVDCGKLERVRSDNPGLRCVPCGRDAITARSRTIEARHSRSIMRQIAARGADASGQPNPKPTATCAHCAVVFTTTAFANRRNEVRYCGRACMRAARNVERACKECGKTFIAHRSRLSGKTNASANFCRRECYNIWLCRTGEAPMRDKRWPIIRDEALRRAPFCAFCGRTKNLDVHHIVPWRISQDNAQDNLMPFCRKHHKRVEATFLEIERDIAPEWTEAKFILRNILSERQDATRMKLLEMQRAKTGR